MHFIIVRLIEEVQVLIIARLIPSCEQQDSWDKTLHAAVSWDVQTSMIQEGVGFKPWLGEVEVG